ncbi:hypothetical protein PROFUN_15082 [Planoprotostelium fungivorum]|uniref:Uncharacterized protein n=1 Tax=Planoprotostelium fungivorum TaxID=1890364 RepID=A0A2P6MXU9_9EUKA|nr:hypothetical protein PROFUN_15082 [Planoprotostelium fungivorum]
MILRASMDKEIKESVKSSKGTTLHITEHKISKKIDRIYKELPNLKTLTLSKCSLQNGDIVELLKSLPHLETLILSSNPISALPDTLSCQDLSHFSMTDAELTDLPRSLLKLPHLKELDLSNNKILQPDFGGSQERALRHLNLSHNAIHTISSEVVEALKNLEQLNLEQNRIKQVPGSICKLTKLLSLNLSHNDLTVLPEAIGQMQSLTELLVKGNKLTAIPTSVGLLKELKTLSLYQNQLTSLPDSIQLLKQLLHISLQHNLITELPAGLGQMKQLSTLQLDHNHLRSLPKELVALDNLTFLDVSYNQLETIPKPNMRSLGKFMLDNNRLKELPDMSGLPKLTVLSLHLNHISDPASLKQLKNNKLLFRLTLKNNPLPPIALEFISKYGEMAFVQKDGDVANNSPMNSMRARSLGERGGSELKNLLTKTLDTLRFGSSDKKSADAEVGLPEMETDKKSVDFSKMSADFETMLEELEVTEEKKKEMRSMPVAAKMKLVSQFRGVETTPKSPLISSPSRFRGTSRTASIGGYDNPKSFTESIRTGKATPNDLVSLTVELKSASRQWVSEIVQREKVIAHLLDLIRDQFDKCDKGKAPIDLLYQALVCLRALVKRNQLGEMLETGGKEESEVTSYPAKILIMGIDHPKMKVRAEVSSMLEAFDAYGQHRQLQTATKFGPLVENLKTSAEKSNRGSETIEQMHETSLVLPLKTSSLSLINRLVSNEESIENRYYIRADFINQGLLKAIQDIQADSGARASEHLSVEVDFFYESMNEDQQDLPLVLGRNEFMNLLNALGQNNFNIHSVSNSSFKMNARASMGSTSPSSPQITAGENFIVMYNYVNISAKFAARMSYTPETMGTAIISKIASSFGVPESEHQELIVSVCMINNRPRDIKLDPKKTAREHGFEGEVRGDISYKPWRITVKMNNFRPGKHNEMATVAQVAMELSVTVDVSATFNHIVQFQYQSYYAQGKQLHQGSHTMEEHLRASEGYGLYWNDSISGNSFWLSDTDKLITYALNKKKGNLELRLRPLGVQLHYTEGPPRVVYFDQHQFISKLIVQAADAMNINPGRRQNLGLVVDPEDQNQENFAFKELTWLEPGRTLAWYHFDQMVSLRIELKPIDLPVTFGVFGPAGQGKMNIQLDFTSYLLASDLYQAIRESKPALPAEMTEIDMVMLLKSGKEMSILPEQSLRDPRLPYADVSSIDIRVSAAPRKARDAGSIWMEQSCSDTVLMEKDSTGNMILASGTINKILEHITSDHSDAAKAGEVFYVTYPSFTNAKIVVQKLAELWHCPNTYKKNDVSSLQSRICKVIKRLKEEPPSSPMFPLVKDMIISEKNGELVLTNPEVMKQFMTSLSKKERRAESAIGKAHRKSILIPDLNLQSVKPNSSVNTPRSILFNITKLGRSSTASSRNLTPAKDLKPARPSESRSPPVRPPRPTSPLVGKETSSPTPQEAPSTSPPNEPIRKFSLASVLNKKSPPAAPLSSSPPSVSPTSSAANTPRSPSSKREEGLPAKVVSFSPTNSPTMSEDGSSLFRSQSAGKSVGRKVSKSVSEDKPVSLKPKLFKKINFGTVDRNTFFEVNGKMVAQHLAYVTSCMYGELKTTEFLKLCWAHPRTQHLSPGIIAMINLFNDVSAWVASCIVGEVKLKNRSDMLVNLIKIAGQLKKLGCFHLLVAFITGINNSAVLRLKWTQKKVPVRFRQELLALESLVSMEGSYKVYRNMLTNVEGNAVPYIGVTLQDLTFMDENPEKIGNQINFMKQRMVYNVITTLLSFQTRPRYPFGESSEVEKFLATLPRLESKVLYDASLKIEPRNAARGDIK